MAEYKWTKKEIKEERGNIVRGAKSHIQSILVALKKFKGGSTVERDYAMEHFDRLKHYLDKL